MNKTPIFCTLAILTAAIVPTVGFAQSLSALTTFGGGDGWRAPNEIISGDTAGTATGINYNYLQTGSLERGLAFNPVTGNLILVSRSTAGNGIRVLSGTTGADVGFLAQGSGIISGGTFTTNTVGVTSDGSIFVNNLQANVTTGAFKIYNWANEAAAAPTTYFNSTVAGFSGTPRIGDSLDVTGTAAAPTIVAGMQGVIGYTVIAGASPTATAVPAFTPSNPAAGDFRLGITFAGTANDVWGKQTGAGNNLRRSTYTGSAGTLVGTNALTSAGEMAMDFASFDGRDWLATLDANSSLVRVYDVTAPATPTLVASLTTTSGTLAGNGNATGSIKFGNFDAGSGTIPLYAMSTNQGIQALTFSAVPEPTLTALAVMAPVLGWRLIRRRRTA